MKSFEIVARLFGRQFNILSVTIKEEEAMKAELVRIRITNSHGIGYTKGQEYDVTPAEALKLCQDEKAIALTEMPAYRPEVETATLKMPKAEKRTGKK